METLVNIFISITILCLSYLVFIWMYHRTEYWMDKLIVNPRKQIVSLFILIFLTFLSIIFFKHLISNDQDSGDIFRLYSCFTQSAYFEVENIMMRILYIATSFLGAIIFSGLLISTLTNSILCRIEKVQNGTIRYHSLSNQDIILGVNETLVSVIMYLANKNKKHKIIIVTDKDKREVSKLLTQVDHQIVNRIIIYKNHLMEADYLSCLSLKSCNRIFILGDECVHQSDTSNIFILQTLVNYLKENIKVKRPIPLYISYFNQSMLLNYARDLSSDHVLLFPFNRNRLYSNILWGYGPLYHTLSQANSQFRDRNIKGNHPLRYQADGTEYCCEVVIVGFTDVSEEVLKCLLETAHFACFDESARTGKTHITIISDSSQAIERFSMCNQYIHQINDIVCEFVHCGLCSSTCLDILADKVEQHKDKLQIILASEHSTQNVEIANHLPEKYYSYAIPVFIYAEKYNAFACPLDNKGHFMQNMILFGHSNMEFEIDGPTAIAQALRFIHCKKSAFYEPQLSVLDNICETSFYHWFGKKKIKNSSGLVSKSTTFHFEKATLSEQIDMPKLKFLSLVNSLYNIFDTMGLEIVEQKYELNGSGEKLHQALDTMLPLLDNITFYKLYHQHEQSLYILNGYRASDTDVDDFPLKKIKLIRPFSQLVDQEQYISKTKNYVTDILIWLVLNNFKLVKKGTDIQ